MMIHNVLMMIQCISENVIDDKALIMISCDEKLIKFLSTNLRVTLTNTLLCF